MQYDLAITYLPHDTPMVMIQDVLLVNDENCICRVEVSKQGILALFLNDQFALPNYFAIELMAQTIGVWNGFRAASQPCKIGMLLGGRAIEMALNQFPLGSQLDIYAKLVFADTKLASFDCEIKIGETSVAMGRLNVYQPDNAEFESLFGSKRLGE